MDSQLSPWGDTDAAGCAPGQYLVSGRPLPLSLTKESQEQVENGALEEGQVKVLEGGAWEGGEGSGGGGREERRRGRH